VGTRSFGTVALRISRTESELIIRVMPSRQASAEARALFPTPVTPPIRIWIGRSSRRAMRKSR